MYNIDPLHPELAAILSDSLLKWQYRLRREEQTDRQNVLFAIKITNMMINKETVKRQEISIKIETIAGMETTL